MNNDNIWLFVFWGAVLFILAQRIFARKKPRILLPDFQRAVKFVDGAFGSVLEPGNHEPAGKNEQITVVDMRPQPIVVERIIYQDAMQAPSVISIAAELVIFDPFEAVTKLKNLVNDSIAIIRDQLRSMVSKRITDPAPEMREKLAGEITLALNNDLRRFGVQVQRIEVTELWSRPIEPPMAIGAN
ncbi:MAG: SPFH domain-containing protein [Candidatus Sulfotelmatobacter sp.]